MRLFVTGAGGFLGAAVVRAAIAAGHDVCALVRRPSPRLAGVDGVEIVTGDLTDRIGIDALLHRWSPDTVIHSAWAGLQRAERQSLNQFAQVEICWRLAESAARAGASRFVGIGSQDEYGPVEGPIDEDRLPRPVSAYGAAKLAASTLSRFTTQSAAIGFAWMRLFATYGPGDSDHWLIPTLAREMRAGQRPRTTAGTQLWDYLYIDDAARGVLAAAVHPDADGVYNLSSGHAVPVRRIIETIRDAVVPGMELVFGEVPFGPNQIMHMEGRNARLRTMTAWSPQVTLADGIARTIAAQDNGAAA